MPRLPKLTQMDDGEGTIVTFTVPKESVKTIARYRYDRTVADIRAFVQETVHDTIRWMDRMINGLERYQLDNLEHWTYNERTMLLSLKDANRDYQTVFDMTFTTGSLETYNYGLATILNSFWYKQHALPTAVVELIAAADLLYNKHNGHSPASAAGLQHVDVGPRA